MDFRKIFNDRVSPGEFDAWRTRYCDACFADVIAYAGLDAGKTVLEIGPGTGQATEPILKTGCEYLAIELGENFTEAMKERFGHYPNFNIVGGDFETYDFKGQKFDLIYSAATIQWIPEAVGFPKVYDLLKSGGTFAMMSTSTDYRSADEALYAEIQKVYDLYFHPETPYTCHLEKEHVLDYGFTDPKHREYRDTRVYNADEFISWTMIMAPHLTLPEPDRSHFIEGVRKAILSFGNRITLYDTTDLYLARKP